MNKRPSSDQSNAATFAALMMVLVVCLGLLMLAALVIPDVLWLLAVVIGMGLFVVLHYVTWGRWLTRTLREQEQTDQAFVEPATERRDASRTESIS